MDKTLKKARSPNMQRRQKNVRAWRRFALNSGICHYCGHDGGSHLTVTIQPISIGPPRRRNAATGA